MRNVRRWDEKKRGKGRGREGRKKEWVREV